MSVATIEHYDIQALAKLYDQHSPGIFRYAVRLMGNRDLAEECVSETFSKFLQALKKESAPAENARTYLYHLAHNWITDYYRNEGTPKSIKVKATANSNGGPSRVVSHMQLRERIRIALLSLPLEHQRVIELRFLDNLSHEETAQVLGRSVGAVKVLQDRALKSLRVRLYQTEE